jgi:hypothetical protein
MNRPEPVSPREIVQLLHEAAAITNNLQSADARQRADYYAHKADVLARIAAYNAYRDHHATVEGGEVP